MHAVSLPWWNLKAKIQEQVLSLWVAFAKGKDLLNHKVGTRPPNRVKNLCVNLGSGESMLSPTSVHPVLFNPMPRRRTKVLPLHVVLLKVTAGCTATFSQSALVAEGVCVRVEKQDVFSSFCLQSSGSGWQCPFQATLITEVLRGRNTLSLLQYSKEWRECFHPSYSKGVCVGSIYSSSEATRTHTLYD